jgi:hypothetical protein
MALDVTHERHQAHAYLDRLPADQLEAVRVLLERMLSPLERNLALAPIDDEPVTPEEAAAIEVGIASLERSGGVPMEEVLADFGLTMDEFHAMTEPPAPDESNGNG